MSRTDFLSSYHMRRLLHVCVVAALVFLNAVAPEFVASQDPPAEEPEDTTEPLKTVDQMVLPSAETLMTGDMIDWIVLKTTLQVLPVQPVYPRPNTVEKLKKQLDDLNSAATRPKPEPGESEDEYRERIDRLKDEATNLTVMLPDDVKVGGTNQAAEYVLNVQRNIERIIYHEDLMLRRADALITDGALDKAFEVLLILQRRFPGWPGYEERRNRLILAEANARLVKDDLEAALAFFEELYGLAPGYSGLQEGIGRTVEQLVTRSRQAGDLPRARYYIARLRQRDAKHPIAVSLTEQFTAECVKHIDDANTARSDGQHAEALKHADMAAHVWPSHPSLRSTYRNVSNRYQVLRVGVTRFPGDPTPFFLPTPADHRHHSLLSTPLFEIRKFERAAFYQSRYFEQWTPTDLGRQIVFSLRPTRSSWESNPLLTAPKVVRSIGDRLRPESRWYDERLTTFISSMQVRSPHEFVVNFSSVPVRPQALFRFPIRSTSTNPSSADDETGTNLQDLLSTRFRIHERSEDDIVFQRVIPQADRQTNYTVEEVVETRYKSHEAALQGLLRGDVSVLPDVPIWLASQFENDDQFFVEKYQVPTTHVLQFNPKSKPLKNPEFRRALARSLDRERILNETILRTSTDNRNSGRGRVVSGPFPTDSYAYRVQSKAKERDLPLAFSLMMFSKKRFKGELPELIMVVEPGEEIRQAATAIVAQWDRMGVKVTIVDESAEKAPENWDIVYRTVRMVEPVTELWPFLTMKTDARVEDLEHLPDWLRQQLVELEQAVDFNSAVDQLQRLHFRLNQLVHLLPLWEIDDVIVIRKKAVQGFPVNQMTHPYQNVERWVVQPWYPDDIF